MAVDIRSSRLLAGAGALAFVAGVPLAGAAVASSYVGQILTDNICCEEAHTDPRLAKAWGLTFDPSGVAWVAAPFAGRAELLDGDGVPQSLSVQIEVPPLFNGGFVTGVAFSPGNGFPIPNSVGPATPARFLFVTLEGTILGWTPTSPPQPQNTLAPIILNNFSRGDLYTGAAVAQAAGGPRLYIADVSHARVIVLDEAFAPVAAAFTDHDLPPGYSPFNVRVLGGRVFVSYAVNAASDPGNGFIDTYDLEGTFQSRLVSHGPLNAPWGMALAPANFGRFSGALLVGNVGDGVINAFDPNTGAFLGALSDATGAPIVVDGLRGIEFGNGLPGQANNTLYFAASPTFGVVGQFGRIDQSCPVDFTRDGQITVQDIFGFVGAWFARTAEADFNGDNAVTVQDVFKFLTAWFVRCG